MDGRALRSSCASEASAWVPERVRRSLQRQGLRPVYRRAYVVTIDSAHRLPVAPNLLDHRFDGWKLDQAWTADITCIATNEGWLYLAAVMDLASRRIVGWSMSESIDAKRVCMALRSAWWHTSSTSVPDSARRSAYAICSSKNLNLFIASPSRHSALPESNPTSSFEQSGMPHEVWVALPEATQTPALSYPTLRITRLRGAACSDGIQTVTDHGDPIRVYSAAKTVADCFKFRNKIGLDVALEALKAAWHGRKFTMVELSHFARINRVERVMQPYLEAVTQ